MTLLFIKKYFKYVLGCLFILPGIVKAQHVKNNESPTAVFYTDVPAQPYSIILGRPTEHTVTISIMANQNLRGYIQYGIQANRLISTTAPLNYIKGQVSNILLDHLEVNKQYYYRFICQLSDSGKQMNTEVSSFHTPRLKNNDFTFTIQADSHLDENAGTEMYTKSLMNMASDSADFLIDLGDTWMTDKYQPDYTVSLQQYIAQRYYFSKVCQSAFLFSVLGNHDGEFGQQARKQNPDNMKAWATSTRKQYYINPFPNAFYSGNAAQETGSGTPENYYAYEWGNALFIVLDPFRYTTGNKDPWQRTLGVAQYQWLQHTLEKSTAAFKFVFIHNLVGGVDLKGRARGGMEAAAYFEWGGKDTSGVQEFSNKRSGWEHPIHDLLVKHHVNIVFHGHDHFFAKQEKDGLIYQLVPQPGALHYGNINSAAEYGYRNGKILNVPGYMRIRVEKEKATVELIQNSIDLRHKNKEVLYSYTIQSK